MENKKYNDDKMFDINIENEEFSIKLRFINYFNYKEAFEFIFNLITLLRENNNNINNEGIIVNFIEEEDDEEENNGEKNNLENEK